MSADSPRRGMSSRSGGLSVPAIVPPQVVSDRSILDSAIGFISDVTLAHQPLTDPKDTITWARFESMADISDPRFGEDWELEGNVAPPLLLILGYGMGVQVWAIPANGEAIEVLSWRHGTVTALRILPTPSAPNEDAVRRADELMDAFAEKRPLMAMCDGFSSKSAGGPPPQYCAVNFISLKTGIQVKTIKFKNAVVDILANRTSIAITFNERIAIFDARTLEDRLSITTCYLSPGINPNPVALGSRWLAYAEHKLLHSKRSGGGCDGEGVASYTATMLNAAKSFGKGLRELGEQVAAGLTGTSSGSGSGNNSKNSSFDSNSSGDVRQAGVVTIMDIKFPIKEISPTSGTPISINGSDPYVAHFIAHSDAIVAMEFDNSGMLLITADKRGHDFHVFRIQPHPVGSSLAAVHHLYVLHRGDTSAKVQNIACSLDSRWIAISTLRGTTHVFPITPYGGAMGVRTHTSLHVVNKLSRFHRSAGLSAEGRSSSPISHSESTTFSQSLIPYHNPTLPPYTRPTVVLPLAQLRQPFVLGSPPGSAVPLSKSGVGVTSGGGGSQRQRLSSLSDDSGKPLSVCAIFAKSRSWLLDPPMIAREAPHRIQCKAVDSLFVMAGHGALIQYDLDTKLASNIAKEKICDETPIELEVEAKAQWNLGRKEGSQEIMPPLSVDNWLVKDRNSCMLTDSTRQFDDSDDRADSWLSQVEIITHAGPHRRLWMGPQFVFKTYNTPSGSNLSHIEAEAVDIGVSATTAAVAAAARPERSSPLNMPLSATARASVPVLIESGSYSSIEQSPKLMDRFRHEHLDSDFSVAHGDSRLKEDLADAMRESPSVSKDVTGRLSCDTAYDCAPYYDALAEHSVDDDSSSYDSSTHRSAAAALAHALPNIYSYAAYSSVDTPSQPRSIEKVVNPLGTVTTITAGMTSELSTDILDEVVSKLAAEECIIHENCDESLFRPVVAIFCDEKSRIAGEEAKRQQELCKPPEVIGTKLIVPVIDKERDDELCKKEKQKSSIAMKEEKRSEDLKVGHAIRSGLGGKEMPLSKEDQRKFDEMVELSKKTERKSEESGALLIPIKGIKNEASDALRKKPELAASENFAKEFKCEDDEKVFKTKKEKDKNLQIIKDNEKETSTKKMHQNESSVDQEENKDQKNLKESEVCRREEKIQKSQKKIPKKGGNGKEREQERKVEAVKDDKRIAKCEIEKYMGNEQTKNERHRKSEERYVEEQEKTESKMKSLKKSQEKPVEKESKNEKDKDVDVKRESESLNKSLTEKEESEEIIFQKMSSGKEETESKTLEKNITEKDNRKGKESQLIEKQEAKKERREDKIGSFKATIQEEESLKAKKVNESESQEENAQREDKLNKEENYRSQAKKIDEKDEERNAVKVEKKSDEKQKAKVMDMKADNGDETIQRKVKKSDTNINTNQDKLKSDKKCEGNACKIDMKAESKIKEKKNDHSEDQDQEHVEKKTKQNEDKADQNLDKNEHISGKNFENKERKYKNMSENEGEIIDESNEKQNEIRDIESKKLNKCGVIKADIAKERRDENLDMKRITHSSEENPTKQTAENAKQSANQITADTENLIFKVKIKQKDKSSRRESEEDEDKEEINKNEAYDVTDSNARQEKCKKTKEADSIQILPDSEQHIVKTKKLNVADLEDSLIELNESHESIEKKMHTQPEGEQKSTIIKTVELSQPVDIYHESSPKISIKNRKKKKAVSSASNSECDEVVEVVTTKSTKAKKRLQEKKSSVSSEESCTDNAEKCEGKKEYISQTLFGSFSEIMEKEVSRRGKTTKIDLEKGTTKIGVVSGKFKSYAEEATTSTETKNEDNETRLSKSEVDNKPKSNIMSDDSKSESELKTKIEEIFKVTDSSTQVEKKDSKVKNKIQSTEIIETQNKRIEIIEKSDVEKKTKLDLKKALSKAAEETISVKDSKGGIIKQGTKKTGSTITSSSEDQKHTMGKETKVVDKSEDIIKKSREVLKKSEEGLKNKQEVLSKVEEVIKKPQEVNKKTKEVTKQTKEFFQESKEIDKKCEEFNKKTAENTKKPESQQIVSEKSLAEILKGETNSMTPSYMKSYQISTPDISTKSQIKPTPTTYPITEQPKKSKKTNPLTQPGSLSELPPSNINMESEGKSQSTNRSKTDQSNSSDEGGKTLVFFDKFSPEHKYSSSIEQIKITEILKPVSAWQTLSGAEMINKNLAESAEIATKDTNFPSLGGRVTKNNNKKMKATIQTEEKLIPVESVDADLSPTTKVNKKNRKKFTSTLDELCMLKPLEGLPPLPVLEPLEIVAATDLKTPTDVKTNATSDPSETPVSLINFESPQQEDRSLTQQISKITPTPRGFTEQNLIFALCGSLHYENESSSPRDRSNTADYKSLIENINDEHYMSLEQSMRCTTNTNQKSISSISTNSSTASDEAKAVNVADKKLIKKQKNQSGGTKNDKNDDHADDTDDDDDDVDDDCDDDDDDDEDNDDDDDNLDDDDDDDDDTNVINEDEELQPLISITESKMDYFLKVIKESPTEPPQNKKKYQKSAATAGSTTTDDSEGPMAATTPSDDYNYQHGSNVSPASSGNKLKTKKLEHKINLIAAIEAATSSSTSSAEEENGGGSSGSGNGVTGSIDSNAVVSMTSLAASLAANATTPSSSTAFQQNVSKKKTKRRKR